MSGVVREGGLSRRDLLLLVPAVVAGFLAVTGHPLRATVVAGVGLVIVGLRLAAGAGRFHRGVATIARGAQAALTAGATALAWVATVLPAWLLSSSNRRHHRRGAARWRAVTETAATRRPFSGDEPGRVHGPAVRALAGTGLLVVLLAVNLIAGLAWERVTGDERPEAFVERLGGTGPTIRDDPRASTPALRDEPWAPTHLRELQQAEPAYWPYLLTRPLDFSGDTINIRGWERLSYRIPGRGDRPTVAFFGGSTTFGEGQRDGHTIASEVARIAEAEDLPVAVVNYGQRGWTSWQEALFFEALSVGDDRPEVAVFYDGINEVSTQDQAATAGWPTHYDVDGVAEQLTGSEVHRGDGVEEAGEPSAWRQAVDDYVSHSAAHKLWAGARRALEGDPAGAQSGRSDDADDIGRDAADVYRRARRFTRQTAAARDVETLHDWQPSRAWRLEPAYYAATSRVDAPTIDITSVLDDHRDVFIDAHHTNERGARAVAERMWLDLEPVVRAWHGREGAPARPGTDRPDDRSPPDADGTAVLLPGPDDLGPGWRAEDSSPESLVDFCMVEAGRMAQGELLRGRPSPLFRRSPAAGVMVLAVSYRTDQQADADLRALTSEPVLACIQDGLGRAPGETGTPRLAPESLGVPIVADRVVALRRTGVGAGQPHYLLVGFRRGADVAYWLIADETPPPASEVAGWIGATGG